MNTKRAMFVAFFTAVALGLVAFVNVDLGESPDHSADAVSTGDQDKTLVDNGGDGSNGHDAVVGNSDDRQEEILPDEDPGGGGSHENGGDLPASEEDPLTEITSVVYEISEDETLVTPDEAQQLGEQSDVPDAGNLQPI